MVETERGAAYVEHTRPLVVPRSLPDEQLRLEVLYGIRRAQAAMIELERRARLEDLSRRRGLLRK